ncbi:MAG: PfkB family carbohydrate kinase [Verrucomicrobiota bacterium]|jgi:D-beta-D-heptose 7-phosphate kinase/D-beta-D-heptose 1-phosphate adenosyltransferase
MDLKRLQHILDVAASKRLLVIGDLMLDEFVWGNVSRISPEAPVPVVEVEKESSYPGGAANVARNLREFTSSVTMLGVIGSDQAGLKLTNLLQQEGISTEGLFTDPDVPTIVKTRIIAQRQQVVRFDRDHRATPGSVRSDILGKARDLVSRADAVLIEDYGKGFLDQGLVTEVIRAAKESGTIVTSDPSPKNPLEWTGIATIKPNRSEAFAAAGMPLTPPVYPVEKDEALMEVGRILLQRWQAGALLITLSEQGMMLFRPGQSPYHTPTRAREIFDVSGAGDTSISLYTLGIASGAEPHEAAELANHAAGIVVGKLGTAICSRMELEESFQNSDQ